MKKRFIVLIDFSEYSGNLIKYACDWAKQSNAELLLVHQTVVLAPALTDNESRQIIAQNASDTANDKLKVLVNDLVHPSVAVSYAVSETPLRSTLAMLLAEPFQNIIFVGLKGSGLLKRLFLGSVAIQVIDNTDNIVVAMPRDISTFSHEKIFVAVPKNYSLNLLQLDAFFSLIDHENTHLTFFYLAKPREVTNIIENQLKELATLYADRFKTNFAIYHSNNSFEDIKKVIHNQEDEILIVQKGSRLLTDQLFRKFLINHLVYEGQTPLIILP